MRTETILIIFFKLSRAFLGIGIDDMFVIVQCLTNIQQSHPRWEAEPVEEIVAKTMKHAGVAITITSITDLVVFGIGAISVRAILKNP